MIHGSRKAALSVRRAGISLGLASLLFGGTAAHRAVLPAAAAGQRTGWGVVPSPHRPGTGDNTLVQVSAGSAADAWVVGYDYNAVAGAFRTMIQHWNGSAWTLVRSPDPSASDDVLYGVDARSASDAWAVGYDLAGSYHQALIEHWTGTAWGVVPGPKAGVRDSDLWGVTALSPANVWAVGNERTGGGRFRFRPLVEHWNGAAWTLVRVPSPPLTGVGASLGGIAATSPRDIWAVGNYDTGTRFQPLIEHWNGTRWSLSPAPAPGSVLLSRISLTAPGNGWAVGIREGPGSASQAVIEHWNGQRWTVAGSPAVKGSALADVLALTPHLAWTVGSYALPDGRTHTLIERWDGRAWTVTPSPSPGHASGLLGIAGTQRHLWSAGYTLTSTLILRR